MAWDLLDAHQTDHGPLELYTQGMKEFMIRFDGIELMNSLLHTSEDVLGELSVAFCQKAPCEVLIGGLGLGFTLAATLRASQTMAQPPQLTVAELMPQIIAWFAQYFANSLRIDVNCAKLVTGDAYQVIAANGQYHVICLDIDNGPTYLATNDNQKMYAPAGLLQIYQHLDEDGVCLVWSANEEAALIKQAMQQGFQVYLRYVRSQLTARMFEQYIYVLSKEVLSETFCTEQQLHFKG